MLIYVPVLQYYHILIMFIEEKPISDPPEGSQKKERWRERHQEIMTVAPRLLTGMSSGGHDVETEMWVTVSGYAEIKHWSDLIKTIRRL